MKHIVGIGLGLLLGFGPALAKSPPPGLIAVDGVIVAERASRGARPSWRVPRAARLRRWRKRPIVYSEVGLGEVKGPRLCLRGLRHMPQLDAAAFDLYGSRRCGTNRRARYRNKVLVASRATIPRPMTRGDRSLAQKAVRAFLRKISPKGKAHRVEQVLSADLDGDGRQELVVEVGRRACKKADGRGCKHFSAVLLHSAGKTLPVVWSTERGDHRAGKKGHGTLILSYRVVALADLDGDGVMEIVIRQSYQEGSGGLVVRFGGGKVEILVDHVVGT